MGSLFSCNLSCLRFGWFFQKNDKTSKTKNSFLTMIPDESIDELIRSSIDPKGRRYSTLHKKNTRKISIDSFKIEKVKKILRNLSSFLYIKKIGKGSFGNVYLVQNKKTSKYYAMKILKKENLIVRNQTENLLCK